MVGGMRWRSSPRVTATCQGIPITIKEVFNIVGPPTTWGFPQYVGFVPNDDALAKFWPNDD